MKFGRDLEAYEVPVESPRGNSRSAATHERIQYHLALLRCELDIEFQRLLGFMNFLFALFQHFFYVRALLKDVVSNGSADLVGFYEPSNRLI